MRIRFVAQLTASLVVMTSLACVSRGAMNAPRRLMAKKCPATWETIDTQTTIWGDHDCSQNAVQLLIAHESGLVPLNFGLRVIGRSSDGTTRPINEATVWLREPFFNRVVRIELGVIGSVATFEDENGGELAQYDLTRDDDGFTQIKLGLKTSRYPSCDHGHVVKSIATYPQVMLVTAPGCNGVVSTIDGAWKGARIVELRCGAASPNSAVNPPHSGVPALAKDGKRRAAGRAGYRER